MDLDRYGHSFTPLTNMLESVTTKIENGFKTTERLFVRTLTRMSDYYAEYCRAVNLLILFLISVLAVSYFYLIMPRGMFFSFLVQYLVVASITLFLLMYPTTSGKFATYCITYQNRLIRKIEILCEGEHLERWEEKKYYPFVKSKRNVPIEVNSAVKDVQFPK